MSENINTKPETPYEVSGSDDIIAELPARTPGSSMQDELDLGAIRHEVEMITTAPENNTRALGTPAVGEAEQTEDVGFIAEQYPSIAMAAKRFPRGLKPKIGFKKGPWQWTSPGARAEFNETLEEEVKGLWVILCDSLGETPEQFPLSKITFWMQHKEEDQIKGGLAQRVQNQVHYRRLRSKGFVHPKHLGPAMARARQADPLTLHKASIDMVITKDPDHPIHPYPYRLIHELSHILMFSKGLQSNNKGQVAFIDEGLSKMAETQLFEILTGEKVQPINAVTPESLLAENEQGSQIKDWLSYTEDNGVLHRYLFECFGGLENIRQLYKGKKTIKSDRQLW